MNPGVAELGAMGTGMALRSLEKGHRSGLRPPHDAGDFLPVQTGINLFVKDLDSMAKPAGRLDAYIPASLAHRTILALADGLSGPGRGADVSELVSPFRPVSGSPRTRRAGGK